MSTIIVFQQMMVVFIMIGIGYFMFGTGRISMKSSADMSTLISKVCNPAVIISSALDRNNTATGKEILTAAIVAVTIYGILLILAEVIPVILRIRKEDRKFYNLMTVYGNIGFMGIPVASAVFGSESLIYLAMFILVFNILIYTQGIHVLTKGTQVGGTGGGWKSLLNVGTISSITALLIFLLKIPVHTILIDTAVNIGRCTTFISLVVLGGSMTRMTLKDLLAGKQLYLFTVVRFFLIPCIAALILKQIITQPMILGVTILTLALPAGNLPLMLAEEYGIDGQILTRGIVLTTLLSLFSVMFAAAALSI